MGRALDDLSLRVWITLVQLGGYTKVVELRAAHFPQEDGKALAYRLESLVANGMARARRNGKQWPAYGVTTKCSAPPGYEHHLEAAP
ncbi:MAG: hypothetical protein ACLGJD_12285 [Gammaproteobacteria bacterium]